MAKKKPGKASRYFWKDYYIGSLPQVKGLLETVLAELKASGRLRMLDQDTLTQETLVNASWVWMHRAIKAKGTAALEEELAPAFRQLAKIVAEDMERQCDEGESAGPKPLPRGVTRGPAARPGKTFPRSRGKKDTE